ncbi:MAR-binding filament-like protein 1-1 isoform X1 [Selaginella moellendorffii]|uniref:MAR-binding filament-like protein 1-1 isoform X1 n=1 Tax=Selaginella moellendorffii TaxID=88036 RepID=UPI000D1C42F6|nr:MAR-binding filament-like protein 1-1 isoform X1 [Selaginella moellendorffii]|eukprot:XP_024522572.1 MAR-binding filament-like protein 1-1 isoform X1 [Selaginella moellendorffii]
MIAAMAGNAFAASCPCSTVHRLRMSEFRKDYDAQSFAMPPGSARSRKSFSVSAKSERRGAASTAKSEGNRSFSRRSVMGLVALVSPVLLISGGAKSDVPHIEESEKLRLDMLQSIERRIASRAEILASIETPASTTAPSLKEEAIASVSSEDLSVGKEVETVTPAPSVNEEAIASVSSSAPEDLSVGKEVERVSSDIAALPELQVAATPPVLSSSSPEEKVVEAVTALEEKSSPESGPLGFLNLFGVVGSGVLGALYWLEGRAKKATKMALAEANSKLEESQAAIIDIKRKHHTELADQKSDLMNKLTGSEEERVELCNEITILNSNAKEMQLKLDSQKNVNQNLDKKVKAYRETIQALESSVQAVEDKLVQEEQRRQGLETEVRNGGVQIREREEKLVGLEATIKEQENTEQELRSDIFTTRTALVDAEDRIQNLVKELIVSQSCLEERGDTVHDLEERLAQATARAEQAQQSLAKAQEELTELQAVSKEQLQVVNAALASKEGEVQAANLELDAARAEAKQSGLVIENFQQQVEELERIVAREHESVQKLTEDLNSAVNSLRAKTNEASALGAELTSYQKEIESLRKQKEESKAMTETKLKSLRESLQAEQLVTSQMKQELDNTRTSFQASSMEVKSLSEKLKETFLVNKKVQEELEDVRQTADGTLALLNDEKKKVALAEQQYMETQKALAREELLVQSLRSEFSKAMDAMNDLRKHLNALSKDLQDANVKVASLETEKAILQDALAKEAKVARKFKDKASFAEGELTKVVREREGSVSKARKLEDELSAAESEMGKLKQQMVVMGTVIDSAETRMGSIHQVNAEVASLARKFEGVVSSNVEQKQTLKRQMDKLKEQSKAASDITRELKNMKRLLNHFQQNLNEAELDRVEAEAALQAAVQRNMVTVSEEA